ncbi:MAG: hypothetical protein HUJ97_05315 [Bacteroidales bacterium]|nr:hypothetical protein [Bacteroidales bacterium]
MKNISISSIVLWILAGVSVILTIMFFAGEQIEELTTTGGVQSTWAQTDLYLWWVLAIVALGFAVLLIFAVKTFITMFQQDAKGAITSLLSIVLFFVVMAVCYFISDAGAYHSVVNGESVDYTATEMKVVDMWINAMIFLVSVTVLLVIGGAIKNVLKK